MNDDRLTRFLAQSSGFAYCVSASGTTGLMKPDPEKVRRMVERIRARTPLPICIGFGIKSADDVQVFGEIADGVVVETEMVRMIAKGSETGSAVSAASAFANGLRHAAGLRGTFPGAHGQR